MTLKERESATERFVRFVRIALLEGPNPKSMWHCQRVSWHEPRLLIHQPTRSVELLGTARRSASVNPLPQFH